MSTRGRGNAWKRDKHDKDPNLLLLIVQVEVEVGGGLGGGGGGGRGQIKGAIPQTPITLRHSSELGFIS